ncbi:MAG: ABC transporter ATP-binding protein, partial [Chloroflexota bacterium]
EDARSVLSGVQGVLAVAELPDEGGRKRLRVTFDGEDALLSAMVQALAAQGIPVLNFTEQAQDLESVFMKVTKGIVS